MSITEKMIREWDQKIRQGLGGSLVDQIAPLRTADVPSRLRADVAALARRTGLYKTGLHLLREDYLEKRDQPHIHEKLIAEYAALLSEIGATRIAMHLFDQLKNPQCSGTPFYKALFWMKRWEYDKAHSELLQFQRLCNDPYWLAVCQANLTSTLIVKREFAQASLILEELQKKNKDLPEMVRGIASEQRGQILFFTGQTEEARRHFERALESLRLTNNPSALFARKWLLIIDLFEKPWSDVGPRWKLYLEQIQKLGFWEVHREMERWRSLRFHDHETILKIYFGTPFAGYRRLLRRDLNWTPPSAFIFGQPLSVGDAGWTFDMRSRRLSKDGGVPVRIPRSFHKLIYCLNHDLLRPVAVGSIFDYLYEGEFFDPDFAGQRVYQVIRRLRLFAAENNLPLNIESTDLGFYLRQREGLRTVFCDDLQAEDETPSNKILDQSWLLHLRSLFDSRYFTSEEIAPRLGISRRSANRLLGQELVRGVIESSGKGRATRYRLVSRKAA